MSETSTSMNISDSSELAYTATTDARFSDSSAELVEILPARPETYARQLESKISQFKSPESDFAVSASPNPSQWPQGPHHTHPKMARQPATQGSSNNLQPTKTFIFVNVQTKTGKRDREAESQIRSHAMKRIQQERRISKLRQLKDSYDSLFAMADSNSRKENDGWPLPTESVSLGDPTANWNLPGAQPRELSNPENNNSEITYSALSAMLSAVGCEDCGRPISNRAAELMLPKSVTVNIQPSSNTLLDPFNQTAGSMSHRMHSLLQYYTFSYLPSTLPLVFGDGDVARAGMANDVVYAMEDPAQQHAICAMAAYHQAFQMATLDRGPADSRAVYMARVFQEEGFRHMHSALQIVRSRCDQTGEVLRPTSIAAVGKLVICAAFSNDNDAVRAHLDGLVKLIELRGGIDTFPRALAHHLSRIESNGAWTGMVLPRLPMYTSQARLNQLPLFPQFPSSDLRDFLYGSLYSTASDLLALSQILDEKLRDHLQKPSKAEMEYFEDTFAAAQHGLANFPYPNQQADTSVMYYRQHCWRCAAFIYFNTTIRRSPNPGLLREATIRLSDSLHKSEIWSAWDYQSNVLLWVLFMGLNASLTETERGLFQLEFKRAVTDMKIVSFDQAHSLLRQQLWRESVLEKTLRDLWSTLMQS